MAKRDEPVEVWSKEEESASAERVRGAGANLDAGAPGSTPEGYIDEEEDARTTARPLPHSDTLLHVF